MRIIIIATVTIRKLKSWNKMKHNKFLLLNSIISYKSNKLIKTSL
jgi:hypothetical protein